MADENEKTGDQKPDEEQEWTRKRRVKYWLQILSISLTIFLGAAPVVGGIAYWVWTRASSAELADKVLEAKVAAEAQVKAVQATLAAEIATKEDRENAQRERQRLQEGQKDQQAFLINIKENLDRMIGAMGEKPTPLPRDLRRKLENAPPPP